jgi:hypothetical protein
VTMVMTLGVQFMTEHFLIPERPSILQKHSTSLIHLLVTSKLHFHGIAYVLNSSTAPKGKHHDLPLTANTSGPELPPLTHLFTASLTAVPSTAQDLL